VKKILAVILAAAAVSFLIYAYLTIDKRTDDQLVAAFVTDGVQAVNEHNLSKVMDMVSDDFKTTDDINVNKSHLRLLVAQAFRGGSQFSVQATPITTDIEGTTARLKVHVSVSELGFQSKPTEREINLTLAKETTRRLLFIPATKWRCTGTDSLVLDYDSGL